jgi:hypothetical protein
MNIAWCWIVPLLLGTDWVAREDIGVDIKSSVAFRLSLFVATLVGVVVPTFILWRPAVGLLH